eukprot:c26791_g1_i1 orf=361-1845(+)
MQGSKKRHRVSSSSRLVSLTGLPYSLSEQKLECGKSDCFEFEGDGKTKRALGSVVFNNATTADVVLFLHLQEVSTTMMQDGGDMETGGEIQPRLPCTEVYLHSQVLQPCGYFSTILSERWREGRQSNEEAAHDRRIHINMTVPTSRGVDPYLLIFQLFYSKNFSGVIVDVSTALSCLPVAAELLYDDCITACVKYLEAVPWTEDEEKRIMHLVPCLQLKESAELLARVVPAKDTAVHDMLNGLVYAATHSLPNAATVKAFVAKLLCDHASRDTVRLVLDNAFANSLKTVKDAVEEYSSPNVRGRHDEIEALQRMNLHTALVNGKHLLWLVERMIELRVAENAVEEWSEQAAFTSNLQRVFHDDAWRNIAPGLPALVLRCTCRLANAVAAGSIIVSCQVRMKLVKDWLPVLVVSRDNPSPAGPKMLHYELEDVFLQIILTLPMEDAQDLLPQCLTFATRNVDDCPHLVSAFNTWFRRANRVTFTWCGDDGSDQSM